MKTKNVSLNEEIRGLLLEGRGFADIAKTLDVSYQRVKNVKKKEEYRKRKEITEKVTGAIDILCNMRGESFRFMTILINDFRKEWMNITNQIVNGEALIRTEQPLKLNDGLKNKKKAEKLLSKAEIVIKAIEELQIVTEELRMIFLLDNDLRGKWASITSRMIKIC